MTFGLECKKVKRTGFIPTFIVGGLLAAAVPVVNMAVRSETYLGLESSPIQILMDANWQMMAMLNVLLLVASACLMYHIMLLKKCICYPSKNIIYSLSKLF